MITKPITKTKIRVSKFKVDLPYTENFSSPQMPYIDKELKYIQIAGYYGSQKVFQTTKKEIGTATDIEHNKMYTIPTIQID